MLRRTDFLVVGGGIAGLSFALEAARYGRVTVLAKKPLEETNTWRAQGGIAAAVGSDDSAGSHLEDTLATGAGLGREDAIRFMVERAPQAIEALETWGVAFSRREGESDAGYDLGREGGHSHRRVLHAGDITGHALVEQLQARASENPRIEVHSDRFAIDPITESHLMRSPPACGRDRCYGLYVLDTTSGEVETWAARAVVLATGGAGKAYLYTTNSDIATGDGVAMAARAGCRVANMEFFQFHPTCLYDPKAKSFLISEALRGEGGILRSGDGAVLMADHPLKDLAPRDIVARTIDHEMKRSGADCVFLDMTQLDAEFLRKRFPSIHERCLSYGIDMTREPIPVVPAAHYQCGGVVTDLYGRTDIEHLYAVGEVAHTGVHGGNRLASNSLLEAVVFGREAARDAAQLLERADSLPPLPLWDSRGMRPSDESVVVSHSWDEIRRFMWNYVGIVRSTARLERALRRLDLVREEIKEYYWRFLVTPDLLELRNIYVVARLIVRSALERHESRGLHYLVDQPEPDDRAFLRDTVLRLDGGELL